VVGKKNEMKQSGRLDEAAILGTCSMQTAKELLRTSFYHLYQSFLKFILAGKTCGLLKVEL
jgi:hypothetical protein